MISRRDIISLIERDEVPGSPVLSLYLDVDQSQAANLNRGFEAALKSELRLIEQQLEDRNTMTAFRADAEGVLSFVANHSPAGRTLVMFCDASEDFLWHWESRVRIGNGFYWSARPQVRPLLEAFDEHERFGVILTDRAHARVFTVFLQEIEENHEAFAEAEVRHHKASGSDHRLSQMNIQRKADEHARWHLKRVADLTGALWSKYEFDRLVLAGPAGAASELYSLLPKRLRQRVVDSITLPVNCKPDQILQETLQIEQQVERAGEQRLVGELITAAAKKARAVVGFDPTIRAAQEGRIWQLLYASGLDHPGSECVKCGLLFRNTVQSCPYCGQELSAVTDVVERLVKRVVSSGGRAEEVRDDAARRLVDAGGMGAFLRF